MGILVDLYFFEANCQKVTLSFSWGGYDLENAATLTKDGFLFADSKLEVYQEWVLFLKHLKSPLWVWYKAINKVI